MYRVVRAGDDYSWDLDDQVQWVMDNLGYSEREAYNVIGDLEFYTGQGYHGIHTQDFDDYCQINRAASASIDRLLTHPSMPKYSGTLYRGLVWDMFDCDKLEEILNSGLWIEPGITSFSVNKSDAQKYSSADSLHNSVLIKLVNSKYGCEIGFLSEGGGEGEVLYPSTIAKKGFRIIDWYKDTIYSERINKKTGKPRIIRENYYVTCRDI